MIRTLTLLLLAASASAQMSFGPASPVSVVRQGLNAKRYTIQPVRAAAGDGAALVTWADFRAVVPGAGTATGAAIRVGLDGKPLDAAAFELPLVPDAVVWNGEYWIVVSRQGLVRINRDGALLDPAVRSFTNPISSTQPVLAVWTGNGIIVAAVDNNRVTALTFDASLRFTGQHLLMVPTVGGTLLGIASDGETTMVLYRDTVSGNGPFSLRSAMFDRRGSLLANGPIYSQTLRSEVALAAGDEGYAFVSLVQSPGSAAVYEAVYVGRDNAVQGKSAPFGVSAQRLHVRMARSMTWDGTSFAFFPVLRSGSGSTDLFMTRIAPGAPLVGPAATVMPWQYGGTATEAPVVLLDDGVTLLVEPKYIATLDGGDRLFARASADPLSLGSAAASDLIIGAFPQETPAVASSATQSLVVWRERTRVGVFSFFDVYATRVTDGGKVLDPQSRLAGTSSCDETAPVVVSTGLDFLVAWFEDRAGTQVRVVRANGALGTTTTIRTFDHCDTARSMRLTGASNGTDVLFVWTERGTVTRRIVGMRVSREGLKLDPQPIEIGVTPDVDIVTQVASDGRDWLVTFGSEAMRVASTGALLSGLITFGNDAYAEGVFWNGTAYVAWVRYGTAADAAEYRLFRVARDGTSPTLGQPLPDPVDVPLTAYAAKPFTCRSGVCLAPYGDRLLRVNPDLSVQLLDVETENRITTVLAGASQPLLVYVRRPAELPFGGVPRVFVQGTPTDKGRAVRH